MTTHCSQSLSADVATHHAQVIQLLNIRQNLEELINIDNSDDGYEEALDVIAQLREKVDTSLKRLLAFGDNWRAQEQLVDKLEIWMNGAEKKIQALQDPAVGHTRQFWVRK